jgi:hypothetical protein
MAKKDSLSASTVTGTGEFARKGQHVIAAVEIRSGAIHSVGFSTADGSVPDGSEEVVHLLTGRTVREALGLSPQSLERHPSGVYEVLFEAFYRAVETCLDPQ